MKKMQTLLILFIVAVTACNQKKDNGNARSENPSPAETGMYNGREMKVKEREGKDTVPRRQPAELQVRNVEVQVLGDSTKIGRPGDMLLTFTGQGFVFTANNPVLKMGNEEISDTYSNEEGTELYVVVAAQNSAKLMRYAGADALSIVNPDKKEVRITQKREELMGKMQKAGSEKVNLVYTTYGVARKRG